MSRKTNITAAKDSQSTNDGPTNEEINYKENDDHPETMAKVIKPKTPKQKWMKYGSIAVFMVITVIIIISCILLSVYINNSNTANNVKADGMDYVLPNDTIIVSIDTNTSIMGQFYVNHNIDY